MWICPDCKREFKRTNQSHYCGSAPASVDEYILRQDKALQPALIRLRTAIREAIPEAEETIAWGTPAWKKKRNIIRFAVSKNHIGVYTWVDVIPFFADRLKEFETDSGVIRLKIGEEPLDLIADVAKRCFALDRES